MRNTLIGLLTLAWAAAAFPAVDEPTDWIDAATGHRVIRLSTEPGSSSQYFHDNTYSPEGDKLAGALDYVPLPDAVTNQIRTTWKSQIKDASGKPVY